MGLRCRFLMFLLTGVLSHPTLGLTVRSATSVPSSVVNEKQDLKTDGTNTYVRPTTQALGQFGHNPYSLALLGQDPLLASLLLSSLLSNPAPGLEYGNVPYNLHSINLRGRDPIISLLLWQYGKYLPYGLGRYGLYGYSAPNNVEDNKPFGSYKYESRL